MQTEVEAFLKRILRFPDDDAPRLIFADWLEDQLARTESTTGAEWSPERGRFIRIQIVLARMKEEEEREIELTGLCKRDNAQNEFEREEQMLLGRHEADWIAPFPGPAAGAIFCRGFVEQLNIGARDLLRYANELFAASPLRHLCLLDMADAPGVFQCQFLSRLAALSVNGSHRGLDLARALANAENLAGLKKLYLTGNNFDDDSGSSPRRKSALSPIWRNWISARMFWGRRVPNSWRHLPTSAHCADWSWETIDSAPSGRK